MIDGNTLLSESAQRVLKRVQALRALTQKTGLQTIEAQNQLLQSLDNQDMLAVADMLGKAR